MTYAADHAGALRDLTAAGTAVTFTTYAAGTMDEATGRMGAPSTATIDAVALQKTGNPRTYDRLSAVLGLTLIAPLTLLVAPTTYGARIPVGATVTWAGVVYTVRDVQDVAPDGTPILATVVASV